MRLPLTNKRGRNTNKTILLKPDIVWRIGCATAAVIDAKYKAEKPSETGG